MVYHISTFLLFKDILGQGEKDRSNFIVCSSNFLKLYLSEELVKVNGTFSKQLTHTTVYASKTHCKTS